VRNLTSTLTKVQFEALWYPKEATHLKSKRCVVMLAIGLSAFYI